MASPVCVALDFETSGRHGSSACAIGLARIEKGAVTEQYYQLIRPPSSNIWYTHIHGLTWKDLKDAPSFPQIWDEIAAFMAGADYLVAHNATFDRNVLYSCCEAFDKPVPGLPFLDTLKGARKALPLASHRLNIVCDYFGIEIDHHNAGEDAYGCAMIYIRLAKMGITDAAMMLKSKGAGS